MVRTSRRRVFKGGQNLSKEPPKTGPIAPGVSQFHFGPFVLDPAEHRLERQGAPVPLTPRVFALLLALVESAGHLATKETLLQRVWPGTVVEEANLSVQVSRLRRLLAGGRDSTQYVETVPKFGYRFVAPVRVSPAPASGFAPPRAPSAHRQPRTQRASSEGANEHLRLTIQLIRLRDGETLWTEAVEGMLREPLGLREQMTEKIDDTVDRLKTARRRGSGSL